MKSLEGTYMIPEELGTTNKRRGKVRVRGTKRKRKRKRKGKRKGNTTHKGNIAFKYEDH